MQRETCDMYDGLQLGFSKHTTNDSLWDEITLHYDHFIIIQYVQGDVKISHMYTENTQNYEITTELELAGYLHRQIEGFCEQKKTGNRRTIQQDSPVHLPVKGSSGQIFHCWLVWHYENSSLLKTNKQIIIILRRREKIQTKIAYWHDFQPPLWLLIVLRMQ